MEYRKAIINDIPRLIKLRKQQLLDEGMKPVATIDNELMEYFTTGIKDGSFISWIASHNSDIIATSGICFYQLPPSFSNPTGRIAYVTNMFTKKEYRRQGIASDLLKLVINEAKSLNYSIIRLHASIEGKSVYQKIGFIDSNGFMTMRLN